MEKKKIFTVLLVVTQVILLVGMCFLVVQNTSLAKTVKQYVASSNSSHEIYDDTKVVEAYKTGKADGLDEQDKYVLETATKIIKENIKDDMSDYEKEKAIYDWQVKYVAYDNGNMAPISAGSEYSHLPYGVLKYHNAICVGNATTFKLFMDMLEIETQIIHSTENGEHAWDLVKLEDDWYHVDVTFDGGSNGKPGYAYFNVPDSVKDDGNYPWNHEVIPSAEGTKYCYLANNSKELKDVYALPKYVKEQLDKNVTLISFTLKDNSAYTMDTANFIISAMATGDKDMYQGTTYSIGGKTIYTITVSGMEPQDTNEDSQKIMEKLQEIINGIQ